MKQDIDSWLKESTTIAEWFSVSFEIALKGIPEPVPARVRVWYGEIIVRHQSDIDRIEREISDAFFLRLKGLVESQLKLIPGVQLPDWRSAKDLLNSIGLTSHNLEDDDVSALGNFCTLRNCIAHSDGRVDAKAARGLPDLKVGSDVWMTPDTLRNWLGLCRRLFDVIHEVHCLSK